MLFFFLKKFSTIKKVKKEDGLLFLLESISMVLLFFLKR